MQVWERRDAGATLRGISEDICGVLKFSGRHIHWIAIASVAATAGCASMHGQPRIESAYILPDQLQPGDTAVITVKVTDKFGVVNRLEGVVKEDQTITFDFQDSGVPPDDEAGDGIWTIQVDVPFNAPPGTFEFEVTAYTADGDIVVVDDEQGEANPLKSSFTLEIEYPDEPAAAPAEPQ
jgi:hypothetical protein